MNSSSPDRATDGAGDNLIRNPLDKPKRDQRDDGDEARTSEPHDPGDNLITNPLDKPGAPDNLIENPLDKR